MTAHTRTPHRPPATHAPPRPSPGRLAVLLLSTALLTACGILKPHGAASSAPTPPPSVAAPAPSGLAPTEPGRSSARAKIPLRKRAPDPQGAAVPPRTDAVPRDEAFNDWANRPYTINGQAFIPLRDDVALLQHGVASWYGEPFHGRQTANGERYDMHRLSAAHKTMPLPSYARVTNRRNGRSVIVRVNDRGPFIGDRVIDLSQAAAKRLGIEGIAQVTVERLTRQAIRSGSWRRNQGASVAAAD